LKTERKRIGILGISFKAATDDLRESPMIALVEALIGKGKDILIYDSMVTLAHLTGANRQYIENTIPHIASLIKRNIEDVIEHSEVLVVGNQDKEFRTLSDKMRGDQIVIDFSKPLTNHSVSTSSLLMS
jgi:GDP-mannose 6-dehydrogenase